MAAKKKTKTRATKKKSTKRKPAVRKKTTGRKSSTRKKTPIKKKKAVARTPARTPKPAAPVAPVGMERIGVVTHYFTHLSVAIVKLERGILREGDFVHILGHTSDFMQRVESMQVDHAPVTEVRSGQSFGLRVMVHAREHDIVYK